MRNSVLIIGTLAIALTSFAPAHCDGNLKQQEAELVAEFRRAPNGETLLQLVRVREKQGEFQKAIATWMLAKARWRDTKMPVHSSAPIQTWGFAADFFSHRLRRKINLRARLLSHPPQQKQLQRQIAHAAMTFGDEPPADQLDLAVQADLDGDAIDELFYIGSSGPLGKRTRKSMGIAKWSGRKYRVVWRTEKAIPPMVHVTDEDGDGWKEIFCG